ncbi:MAG: 3-methyl-2-oxobutanoate hydroxymethyltransferase [Kiritimatiellia bacterium]|jgi:3-methyl-2-oxobutanoate hydroxymethyltransferase|nr:3-methyl-2-oxobutanoate hydroxymethyltransferase [Kiritimatiellia bacterium]MDP6629523.1 3-methyl-2-oxobutanoate hydroxymethyltransferase [Kiritimatiellia bacterium]MDP6809230.1 3-methyl-2-oxobutanoate hydroxymethyltransferase [Kiritimatiellia bacterium]MDP7022969.1 3-methyl-2-oxobutanoate hydroxymethyltransferase [Kiritimatiellia bacterium]
MKWTTARIRNAKGKQKLACLTAYDYATACLLDGADVPLVLVGDSLGMTMLGYESTLPVTMEEMLHHTAAVVRGTKNALVIGDMPFLSYQVSIEQGVANAGRFLKEAGADVVKVEGGAFRAPLVEALKQNGIPVMGHIGLTPQSVKEFGGYKVQGREQDREAELLADAAALEAAGCFAIVLECIPEALGKQITQSIGIPTIGIGAGRYCDGQVLVTHDMLGLHSNVTPRFAKRYAELGETMKEAFAAYKQDVESGTFPGEDHTY